MKTDPSVFLEGMGYTVPLCNRYQRLCLGPSYVLQREKLNFTNSLWARTKRVYTKVLLLNTERQHFPQE